MDRTPQEDKSQPYHANFGGRRGSWGTDPLSGDDDVFTARKVFSEKRLGNGNKSQEKVDDESSKKPCPPEYDPIQEDGTIRLLKILNYSPVSNKVYCKLEHHDLLLAPPFDALSYTWGSPTYPTHGYRPEKRDMFGTAKMILYSRTIVCDGIVCSVTKNLFEGLRQLARLNLCSYLWVDALCIDQSNLDEKASQILMMGDIYARAKRVIVWLGNDCSTFEFAEMRETLVKALGRYEAENGPNSAAIRSPFDDDFLHRVGIKSRDEWRDSWSRYFEFFQNIRWFRRAWVVQEIALAHEITFICNEKVLPWQDIFEVGLIIRDNGWRHELAQAAVLSQIGGIGDEADRLLEYRDQVHCGGPNDPKLQDVFRAVDGAGSAEQFWFSYFHYMVQEIRRFQATDERDKIYAVLGIANRFMPIGFTNPLTPDYTLEFHELYRRTAQMFIIALPVLSSLSYVENFSRKSISLLPSWVPDYSVALGGTPFIHLGNSDIFNASCALENSYEKPQFTDSGRFLKLNGALFGQVAEVGKLKRFRGDLSIILPHFDICLSLAETYKPTGQDRVEALWRTLIANTPERPPAVYPAPSEYGQYFHDWVLTQITAYLSQSKRCFSQRHEQFLTINKLATNSSCRALLPTLHEVLQNIKQETMNILQTDNAYWKPMDLSAMASGPSAQGFYFFERAAKQVRSNRALFRTHAGHLGLGPAAMKADDEVWLLQQARVPFILRRALNGYHLVGEAYVHGFMNGEMLDRDLKSRIGPVIIV